MFIYTFLLVKTSLLFHKMQFSFACFLATLRQYRSSKIFSLVPGNGWLECLLIALINYTMRGITKLAYIVRVFFVWKTHVVTAGGETWQEVIMQVLEVALTFEFSFLYALFRALIIVSALTSLTLGKLRYGSACHRQTYVLIHISNRKIQSEDALIYRSLKNTTSAEYILKSIFLKTVPISHFSDLYHRVF